MPSTSLVFLQVQFLIALIPGLTTGQGCPKAEDCSCTLYGAPDYVLTCQNITSPKDVSCLSRFLESVDHRSSMGLEVYISSSNMDLLPGDLFEGQDLINLNLLQDKMTEFPYDLLGPSLTAFAIDGSAFLDLKLRPEGFEDSPKLTNLWLRNAVSQVPAEAFEGLKALEVLDLQSNRIEKVQGFEDLGRSLKFLDLGHNPISQISERAFEGLSGLKYLLLNDGNITSLQEGTFDSLGPNVQVNLAGNPLNCNCSLKWLQDWFKGHPINRTLMDYIGVYEADPQCATPNGPLMTIDFCISATARTNKITAIFAIITVFIQFLITRSY